MTPALFTFAKNQQYYTTLRTVIDGIIGFIVGWMLFGFGLWWQLVVLIGVLVVAIAAVTIYFGRKWLGIGMLIGAVTTSIWFMYATKVLGI